MKESIEELREWAKNRTVPASRIKMKEEIYKERKLEF